MLAYLPIFLLIIIISVFFHEIGHLIAYKSNVGLWYIFHDGIYNYERCLILIIGAITTINFSLGIINLIPIKNEYGMMSDGAMAREAKNPYSKEDMSEMVNNAIVNNIKNEQHKQMLQRLYL